ncbi:MAG: hypothetical protein JJE27_02740, partial [Thermoleophilia bacterium]|nr:hypothetical protein [Thermoleophilia bacterium]
MNRRPSDAARNSLDATTPRETAAADLALPVKLVQDDEIFAALATPGDAPREAFVSEAFTPFTLAVAAERFAADVPVLIVAADDQAARNLAADLAVYLPDRPVRVYPARGVLYESHLDPAPHLVGQRIGALDRLQQKGEGARAVVVAGAAALAERVPDVELRPHGFELARGDVTDLGELATQLIGCGYERVDRVEDRGQFATRGDIMDVFPATGDHAVRVELFDIEVESIRRFSTFTQRSLETIEHVAIEPAAELAAEFRAAAEQALAARDDEGDADRNGATPPDIAELLPTDRFNDVLDLAPAGTWLAIAGAEDVGSALDELWS